MTTIYGFQSDYSQVTSTEVDGVSISIAAANVKRRRFFITNTGTHDVYVTFGAVCSAATSSIILHKATTFYPDVEALWVGNICAIKTVAGAGTSLVTVTEFQ